MLQNPVVATLLFMSVPLGILGLMVLLRARSRRVPSGRRLAVSDDRCAACDGADLAFEGAGAYTCRACGYQGGSGRQRAREAAWSRRWRDRSPAERREEALRLVHEARRRILAVEWEREQLGSVGAIPKALRTNEMQARAEEAGGTALNALIEAHGLLADAAGILPDLRIPPLDDAVLEADERTLAARLAALERELADALHVLGVRVDLPPDPA